MQRLFQRQIWESQRPTTNRKGIQLRVEYAPLAFPKEGLILLAFGLCRFFDVHIALFI